MNTTQPYDIIGDIHGHADALKDLLRHLGYEKNANSWTHPEGRKVGFLGDYIDRGPDIRETLQMVRGMVDSDQAVAIMGNHEFNALAYHTPDGRGGWLRAHNSDKTAQHLATLEQFAGHGEEWIGWLDWFRKLPLFLELPGFRMVHAAWDSRAVERFRGLERLEEHLLHAMADKTSDLGRAREILLNGRELRLPDGEFFRDKSGCPRTEVRMKWWADLRGRSYYGATFPESDDVPFLPIPEELLTGHEPYPEDAPPVFIGHYWMPDDAPREPVAPNVACLDYSVAKRGRLTAYRWEGEGLRPENYRTALHKG
jgi:hypothetical protein